MAKLNRGAKRLLTFLQEQPNGSEIGRAALLTVMQWKDSTLRTYLSKNMLAPFILPLEGDRFRVIKGKDSIRPEDIETAFSQKKPLALVLARGDTLHGNDDQYTLVSQLGAGAVGHVWRALAKSSGDTVAVKIVNPRPDLLKPSVFNNVKKRFGREARNSPAVEHDAIIKYLDHGTFRAHPFLTMQMAEESVRDILDVQGTLSDPEAGRIVSAVSKALRHLHEMGCVHRDVKPHNILRTSKGFVLADLGIVRWEELNPDFISAGTITTHSIQLGSWYYMAPEQQSRPHEATALSDVYALGVTWYELLAGEPPLPQTVAAGDLDKVSGDPLVNETIERMVSYRHTKRPSIDAVLEVALRIGGG